MPYSCNEYWVIKKWQESTGYQLIRKVWNPVDTTRFTFFRYMMPYTLLDRHPKLPGITYQKPVILIFIAMRVSYFIKTTLKHVFLESMILLNGKWSTATVRKMNHATVSTTHPVNVIARQGWFVFLEYIVHKGMQAEEHRVPHGCCRVSNRTKCFLQDNTGYCVTWNLKTPAQNADVYRETHTKSAWEQGTFWHMRERLTGEGKVVLVLNSASR